MLESFTWCYIISSIYAICTSPCTNEWGKHDVGKVLQKILKKKNHPIIWFWISSCSSWIWFVSFTFVLRRASFEYVILFILITKQSPVILFRAQKQRKTQNQNGHCLVKMTRHEKWCFAPIFQTEYHFSFLLLILMF